VKNVSIITVNYNTEDDTHAFLKSAEKAYKPNLSVEIIVVDNGSKNVFTLSGEEKKKQIILIRSDINTGFAGGYNIGMKRALAGNADYILIVNNDTVMDESLITNLLTVLEHDPKIGVTVPKIYFAKGHEFHKDRYKKDELGKVFWYAGGSTDWNHVTSIHRGVDEVDHGQYDKIERIDFATGCCMMFSRDVLEKVGLFDERYFLYYEDADLNERIKRAGYEIYYVPTAVLVHINAASSGGAGNGNVLQDYFITRNRMLFGMSYAPLRTKIALFRESMRLLGNGRPYQKQGLRDFYLRKFNKGTFFDKS
jgi:GT2 family glycosyltransferase